LASRLKSYIGKVYYLRKRRGKPRLYGLLDRQLYRLPYCEEASRMDKCLDFEAFSDVVLQLFNEVIELKQRSSLKTFEVWSSYLSLTLIMLANGLRIREALRAARIFCETGERKLVIKAEKGGDFRSVIIPEFLEKEDLEHLYKMLIKTGEDNTRKRVLDWLRRVFGVNPHSIRYSFIRYHTLTGRSPEEIAKALGLKATRNIKRYYLRGLQLQGEGEGNGGASGAREGFT
jgi:hypothetical protein